MDGEERDFLRGLGLAAIALVSAVLTATVVIGAGSGWLSARPTGPAAAAEPAFISTGG